MSGVNVVSEKSSARAGSNAIYASTISSGLSGEAAAYRTNLSSSFFITVDVNKQAELRSRGVLTSRLLIDGLAMCNQTEPSAVGHVVAVRATTKRSKN